MHRRCLTRPKAVHCDRGSFFCVANNSVENVCAIVFFVVINPYWCEASHLGAKFVGHHACRGWGVNLAFLLLANCYEINNIVRRQCVGLVVFCVLKAG